MILLVRIDERLIHGQVAVTWRGALGATVFAVVDDEIASAGWERDLVVSGVPDGTRGEVFAVGQAAELWESWLSDGERRLVLFACVASAVALLEAGVRFDVLNVGGLHERPGRREFLPYVFLDEDEMALCRRLCGANVRLEARNVPSAGAVEICRRLEVRE